MNIENLLRPYNKEHSIKEVIFTLFFTHPIEDYSSLKENFQKILSKRDFEEPETISVIKYKINSENPTTIQSDNAVKIGFLWQKKNKDTSSIKQSFQIRNLEEQSFISFHELSYKRWANFKEDFIDILSDICKESIGDNLIVAGLNLTYIDEFEWIGESKLALNQIFKNDSSYLPQYFFNSHYPSVEIAALINEDESTEFLSERIAIDIQKTLPNSTILITHTVASTLEEPKTLNAFFKEKIDFYLEKTHEFNKKTLENLLTLDVQSLIHLPKKDSI
jgi:hypothetical protein